MPERPTHSTITVRAEVKEKLALAKGDRSWDDFLEEIATDYIDEAIELAERRLLELRTHKARALSLDEVDNRRKHRKSEDIKR